MKKILFLFFFFANSLFAVSIEQCNYEINNFKSPMISSSSESVENGGCATLNLICSYQKYNDSLAVQFSKCTQINTSTPLLKYDRTSYKSVDKCPTGYSPDENNICQLIPVPICTDSQYLDENNTCQNFPPPDFNSSSLSNGSYYSTSSTATSEQCIVGTSIFMQTSYSKITNYNSETGLCTYYTYYCNSDLYFDKNTKSCKQLPAIDTPTTADGLTQDLINACTSNKWVKRWTNDYCSTPAPCYIGGDLEEDYNLQCGKRYVEYDCADDYRLKYYKEVSCSSVFSTHDINITSDSTSSSSDSPTASKVDFNTSSNTDIASIINTQSNLINNNLDGLLESSNITHDLQKDTNLKLDDIKSSLNSIDNKLTVLQDTKNLSNDVSSISSSLNSEMSKGFDKYFNLDYTGGLASSGCSSVPTLKATVYGKTIVIFSQSQLDKWPMDIFRSMIIFMFVFSGVIIAFRSN